MAVEPARLILQEVPVLSVSTSKEDAMRMPNARLVTRFAPALLLFPILLSAQETVTVSAWISARPMVTGSDSGKYMLSMKVKGIPDFALRRLKRDEFVIVDRSGGVYTPTAYAIDMRSTGAASLVAQYTRTVPDDIADRRYLYLVSPGQQTFELRINGLKPVRFDASLGRPRRP